MKIKIVTIGVYGFDELSFFEALGVAKVDTFCDIRSRRGVRGAKYAFANSQRLQARLEEMGIRYIYRKDLGPSKNVREKQKQVDETTKTAKRKRTELSPSFIEAYQMECLSAFDPQTLIEELDTNAQIVALFCVETTPEACHRSLVAQKLVETFNLEVEDILP